MSSCFVLSHILSPGPQWQLVPLVDAVFGDSASGVSIVKGCLQDKLQPLAWHTGSFKVCSLS